MALRHLLGPDRLCGPPLPVRDAGKRDRRLGDPRRGAQMDRRERRLVEEAQRQPGGVELGLDLMLRGLGAVAADDLVGGAGVAVVEELAGDDAALGPPLVAVGEEGRVAGDLGDRRRGLGRLVVPPEPLRAREGIGAVRPQRRRHRIEERTGLLRVVGRADPRLDQRRVIGASARRRPLRRAPVLLEELALHAESVIRLRQHAGELLEQLRLELLAEPVLAPSLADERRGVAVEPVGLEGESKRELAGRCDRPLRREIGPHHRVRLALEQERFLGSAPDQRAGGPARLLAQEAGDAVEADIRRASDRHPLGERARGLVGDAGAGLVALGDVAPAIGFERLLQGREVEPLRALRHRVGNGQPPEGDVIEHRKPDRAGPAAGFLGPRRCRSAPAPRRRSGCLIGIAPR